MVFFQLRSIPGTAWPPLPALQQSQVWAAYQELDRTQWLSAAELERLQLGQLRCLLQHCFEQVPYYRRLMLEAGVSPAEIQGLSDLRRLPLLTRELYQRHFDELQARELPAGMTATWSGHTSGTNGVPIQVRKTNRDGVWWNALCLRDLEWSNLDPRGRLAAIRLLAMKPEDLPRALEGGTVPFWNSAFETLLESGPASLMDIRQDPQLQLAWLERVRPDYLLSLPSNLELLAGLLQATGRRLTELRAIQAIGEPLSRETRERIEAGFGVPVKNLYSTTEAGYMASPCPLGHGLHVHSENVLAEVLDADDRPVAPGARGRLVFTSLHNFITPFVRYDILDDVTLAPGPCPCGRGAPLWTEVDGRRHAPLVMPGGKRKSSMGITLGIRKVAGCHQFQIVQRAVDHVVLHVVPDPSWSAEHAERMRQVARDEMGAAVRVDVETRAFLERPAGGKLRVVVIEVEP